MILTDGWYGMPCWNGLSDSQKLRLIEWGNLPIGSKPEGPCDRPADLDVTTKWDTAPGPRFYCLHCAMIRLARLYDTYPRPGTQ